MNRTIIKTFFALVLVLSAFSIVSAATTITIPQTLYNTLPSDDSTTKVVSIPFTVSSNSGESITLSTSGFPSLWTPTLSKTTDTLGIGGSGNPYTLTLTIPKYQSAGTFNGGITVTNASSTSPQIQVVVGSHSSLIFNVVPQTLTKSKSSTTAVLKNDGNQVISGINVSLANNLLTDSDDNTLRLFLSNTQLFVLNPQEEKLVTINYSEDPEDIDLLLGTVSTTLSAQSSTGINASTTVSFENDLCEFGEVGDDVRITSVSDESSGSGNFAWELLESVEIEVDVENRGDNDEDFIVELVLYDSDSGDELLSLEEEVSIDEDDEETVAFTFIVPADTPDNARLYIKAYVDEDEQCTNHWGSSFFESIDIDSKESYAVGFSDLEFESQVLCGSTLMVDGKVHNIGRNDQDRVLISLFSSELGIDEEITVLNLDEGDSDGFSFAFVIPEDADEKTYRLELEARHRYSRSNDRYDDVTDKTLVSLNVKGGCSVDSTGVTITPTLDSEAKAGIDLRVKVRLTNTGTSSETVNLVPYNFESWAVLKDVQPSSITLASGEGRDVFVTLTAKDDSSGQQSFVIRAISGDVFRDQQVSVFIEDSGSRIFEYLKENWVIALIIFLNVILLVAIIIAIVRIASR